MPLDITKMKYQYAKPEKYIGNTPSAEYKIESEWHEYYSADFHENYFTEDYLAFLKALKEELQLYIDNIDTEIKDEVKVHERKIK